MKFPDMLRQFEPHLKKNAVIKEKMKKGIIVQSVCIRTDANAIYDNTFIHSAMTVQM